ncbi:MAG TPA: TonB-dependent receptor [Longimicrobiaceae bacterium]
MRPSRSKPVAPSEIAALFLALTFLAAPAAAVAQQANVSGRVVDASTGEPIAGATVRVDGAGGERLVTTDAQGDWQATGLAPGPYRASAERIGFAGEPVTFTVPGATSQPVVIRLSPSALPLDALVVTASRRLQRLADAPVTTELITRRDIEIARVSDLSTLLTQRLGIELQPGHPAGEGVMLQGLGSERVLVLLDGQPIVGRLSGTLDISRIPTSMIERVEVVKGSQSSLYGSEAMGGVVNIITRSAGSERWRLGLDATTGSQGRRDLSGTVGGTIGSVDYLLDAGRRLTEVAPGIESPQGALAERWDGLLKVGWTVSPELRLEGSGLLLDERQRWQGGQLFQFADNDQRGARIGAEWSSGIHRLAPTLHWTEFEHLSRRAAVETPSGDGGETEIQRLYEAELLYNFGRGDGAALDLGVEAKREEISSDRVVDADRVLHTVEPFAQATLPIGPVSLVPGARIAWSEEWGAHFTPRVAALLRPFPELAVRASVGQGYRAPAFKELYMEFLNVGPGFSYTVRGNPELQPETSTNVSFGLEWSPGNAYLRTQLFDTRFDDFIETVLAGDSSGVEVYTYGNVARGMTRGIEVEGAISSGGLRAEAGYSYLLAKATDTGQPLLGRPEHSGRASLESTLPLGLRAAVTGVYTGATPVQRNEDDAVMEREAFLRFDASLSGKLRGGLQLSGGVRNLFDVRPTHWPGFTGRHLYVGLGWQVAAHSAN